MTAGRARNIATCGTLYASLMIFCMINTEERTMIRYRGCLKIEICKVYVALMAGVQQSVSLM